MTRTEKLLAELIAIPSVNPAFAPQGGATARQARLSDFGEKNVADFLAAVAARAGLDVEFQKALPLDLGRWGERTREPRTYAEPGSRVRSPHHARETAYRSNLIVRLRPRNKIRRTILLAPHLDTVGADETGFIPRRKNGRLYGRGACDTKGSVAAMFTALCELAGSKNRPQETEIVFVGLIDEENAQAGSRALVRSSAFRRLVPSDRLKSGLQTILAIVGEPTRLRVVTAHKGSLWLELETRGRAAHGATPQFGRNAVHEMARIVDSLQTDYAARLHKRIHPLLGHPTVSVGTICGGTQVNIVPDRCQITMDRRTLPGETEPGVKREILKFLRARNLFARMADVKLAPCLPLETNHRFPLIQEFMRCAGQSKPLGVHYFCDAAVLSAGGIPSVVFGPGDVAQAHTTDEWISLTELERGKNLLLKFLSSQP
jgi:acetylornithine deacetylase/succinyl-diaminopimelate desuccinylase-like protein